MTSSKNCYVSSKLKYRDMWLESGIKTISSWVKNETVCDPDGFHEMWSRYFDEVANCSVFVMYLERGDIPKGALIELGAAMANNKTCYIIWNGYVEELEEIVGTLIYHENVTILESIDDFMRIYV